MSEQAQTGVHEPGKHPDLPPPATTVGIVGWFRTNLFSSPISTVLTILALYILYLVAPPVIQWVFIDADWTGDSREACSREGACWIYIIFWFKQLMYGRYPDVELWRVNLCYVILVAAMIPLFIPQIPTKAKVWLGAFLLVAYPLIALYLTSGISKATIEAWPYRLMGLSVLAVGVLALLPLLGIWRERSAAISIALLILVPLMGLSTGSTWTGGLFYGAPGWVAILTVLFGVLPALVLIACLLFSPWHEFIRDKFWQFGIVVMVLAVIGYVMPVMFWDEVAGPSPPWAVIVTPAMLALAAVAPWGYGAEAGQAGRWVRLLLLPAYVLIAWLIMAGPPDVLNFGALDWTPNTEPFFRDAAMVLPYVETPLWGGLFLTIVIGGVGIVGSLPIGVVLALGRRSEMPVVRAVCIAFIELWRGVPLITVLFMASVMFPLFMPEGLTFDKLIRALIGVLLFSAAYMAEVVRGGLQAIPRGQHEAAEALGLSYWKMMGLIILPQALKLVIPGIVNTFIGLFKDTTLVLIIGLFDFLGMVQLVGTNPNWLGFAEEGYVFTAFGFWVFCFSMSRYSQHLERKLHTGH